MNKTNWKFMQSSKKEINKAIKASLNRKGGKNWKLNKKKSSRLRKPKKTNKKKINKVTVRNNEFERKWKYKWKN